MKVMQRAQNTTANYTKGRLIRTGLGDSVSQGKNLTGCVTEEKWPMEFTIRSIVLCLLINVQMPT